MFVGSGSIRGEELGPIVRYQDLLQIYPYNDEIYRIYVTGEQLRRMAAHIFRKGALEGLTEYYQLSRGVRLEFDYTKQELISLSVNGYEVQDNDRYSVGIPSFHMSNLEEFMGVTPEEVSTYRRPKVVATKSSDVLEEYFSTRELIRVSGEQRQVIHK